jgi:glycosyltransferase involved in cell wall biosynthesis
MSRRLKVLMSAYACEPGKGSEPEVGWQWALQMARFHDVTVLTRRNNRAGIEFAVEKLRGSRPIPQFIYHDHEPWVLALKQRFRATKLYYVLWQKSAWKIIEQLHKTHRYDLMHHVTFAGYRFTTAIWRHGVPCIWGPIGGIESIPASLLPWDHPVSLLRELLRSFSNFIQATRYYVLPSRARATTSILTSTIEMQQSFSRLGFQTQLMPPVGLRAAELPYVPHQIHSRPLKLLFVGNVISLKGIDLALAALNQSHTTAQFTLIGDGDYLSAAQKQVRKLGLRDRVTFVGRLPRPQVLTLYAEHDIFLFPSLHDPGGYAVLEAMCNELPVICLDRGGPALAVRQGCGIKVPVTRRPDVIANLAAAIRWYDQNRGAIVEHGKAARAIILKEYDWDTKGVEMNVCYHDALNHSMASRAVQASVSSRVSGLA